MTGFVRHLRQERARRARRRLAVWLVLVALAVTVAVLWQRSLDRSQVDSTVVRWSPDRACWVVVATGDCKKGV